MARLLRWTLALAVLAVGVPASGAATGWTRLSTPNPTYGGGLHAVSCVSPVFCVAVGYRLNSSRRAMSYVAQWNGKSVRIQRDPAAGNALGVSCVSTTFCMEVGTNPDAHGYSHATDARWNGTSWRTVTLPAMPYDSLEAVNCWSRNGCVAVGARMASATSYSRALVERWNGKAWRVQTAPSVGQWLNHLDGVSCVSGSACLAVGQTFLDAQGRDSKTLSELWNGRRWRILTTPTLPKTDQPDLMAVSCLTATNCVAVGGGSAEHSLILHWTGRSFDQETPAAPQGQDLPPVLSGVSCTSATFCMATGMLPFNGFRAEQWDGNRWTIVDLPGGGSNDGYDPIGGSCPTSTVCLAAGDYINSNHRTDNVVLDKWTGP